ncbi:MAG: hypothetical protein ACERKD_17430 [Prolixibacteraceae bacterium]
MKNQFLLDFLKLHLEANSIVVLNDQVCELITFNSYVSFEKYQMFLDDHSQDAAFIHMDNLIYGNGNSEKYLKCLQLKFKNSLSNFADHKGFLIHKRLNIRDRFDNRIQFDDLSLEVKQKISEFITVQKSSLLDFIDMLLESEIQIVPNRYNLSVSKTQIVEIGNVFFEGGYVSSENGPVVKKDFIIYFAAQYGIKIENPEKILTKIMSRDKPMLFLDKLREVFIKYLDKIENNRRNNR